MTDQNISHAGDLNELETSCKNVQELDLSKNEFQDWDEVILKKQRIKTLILSYIICFYNYF